MFKLFIAIFLFFPFATNANEMPSPASEVYFTNTKTINFARDRFFNAIKEELGNKNLVLSPSLAAGKGLKRDEFIKSHPPAQQDLKNKKVKIPGNISRMIPTVQKDLETKAHSFALIVDCKPIKSQTVSNCGLYLYSRKKQKIVSSAVRYFSIELENPENWAQLITENFSHQMSKEKSFKESRLMSNFLKKVEKNQNTEKEEQYAISASGQIKNLEEHGLSGFSLELAKGSPDYLTTLSFNYHQDEASMEKDKLTQSWGLSVGAKNSTKEIFRLKWEMAYRLHLDFNKFKIEQQSQNESVLAASLAPGFSTRLDQKGKTFFTTSFLIKRAIKLSEKNHLLSKSYWETNWKVGLTHYF